MREIEIEKINSVALIAKTSAILEVSIDKPGNVSPWNNFSDVKYEDFLAGAIALSNVIRISTERGILAKKGKISLRDLKIGELIKMGTIYVMNSHPYAKANTHLGMLLLMIPISIAYSLSKEEIGRSIKKILKFATVKDTIDFYDAIEISNANVGGKLKKPRVSFYKMLKISAKNDRIAYDLINDLKITKFSSKLIEKNFFEIRDIKNAILQSYLELLSKYYDTLIAKKNGKEKAKEISKKAEEIISLGGVKTEKGRKEIERFYRYLHDKKNRFNPGTTADLIASGLMLCLLHKKFSLDSP
ncbi:MAG: triphosphoribosyl-dephospho-CoA synthase [Candidatus Altiarchaeota archaeon]